MAARTPAEIAALSTYTDAEMLKAVRYAIQTLLADPMKEVSIQDRRFVRADLEQLRGMEAFYSGKTANATRKPILLADISGD
jgi:hypothetical protein